MELFKKHYEKVLLGVVLLGLVVSAAFLPIKISSDRKSLEDMAEKIIQRNPKALAPLDLSKQEGLLKRTQAAFNVDFSSTNKLFNPLQWQRKPPPENSLIPVKKGVVGVEAAVVTKTAPLYLIITLDSAAVAESGARYTVGVEREAVANVSARRKKPYYATLNNKNDTFIIRDVRGPADNPTEVVLELNDTGEQVVLRKGTPFKRVDGYTADLKYDPERKTWAGLRVGVPARPPLVIASEEYNVVAITKDEVVLSAKLNNKKTSIPYSPSP